MKLRKNSIPTLEAGARGIIDATRTALAEALRDCMDMGVERVSVSLKGQQIIIKASSEQSQNKSLNPASENEEKDQTIV